MNSVLLRSIFLLLAGILVGLQIGFSSWWSDWLFNNKKNNKNNHGENKSPTGPTQAAILSHTRLENTLADATTTPTDISFWNNLSAANSTSIRQWGCVPRNETPLVFIHIGKAGGGRVRARLAASALDYNRRQWHLSRQDPTYYYPVSEHHHHVVVMGKLVNSGSPNFVASATTSGRNFQFEGTMPCHATTPMGQALGCPLEKQLCTANSLRQQQAVHNNTSQIIIIHDTSLRCDVVYLGHNLLGNELHWLPTAWLQNWWHHTPWARAQELKHRFQNRYQRSHIVQDPTKRSRQRRYCRDGPWTPYTYKQHYEKCLLPEIQHVDELAHQNFMSIENNNSSVVWSQVYASLPVLRVILLRDPFAWLASRFFWHADHVGVHGSGRIVPFPGDKQLRKWRAYPDWRAQYHHAPIVSCDDTIHLTQGWGQQAAREYMLYLCGEHCLASQPTLHQLEVQATYNLRNSFAVVGILSHLSDFFDMLSHRVSYIDTTLNPEVQGDDHVSGFGEEVQRCKERFRDPAFQDAVKQQSPEIAALTRLYDIGVKVFRFQKKEMDDCSSW